MLQQQQTIDQAQANTSVDISAKNVVSQQPGAKSMSLSGEDNNPMRLRGGDGHHPVVACLCICCICCGLEELCCLEAIDDCFAMCC
ncbi:SubName: Full=Uncharacterized protein {ECO:0000313/EMBL:CCA76323.1} [Serendipita indica DSM 11827]|uniref:Uncharacterized protein n=1 Tax=Serendipita indica (strain DSM 11827) TaxID=1109443 RepID=G4TYD0_SERID|nr:SubName: Full=Uncharacterized protein {ECO:0000313/EMBL:CCA76323.1} [Serendipita indica DSM 11827]CAG7853106.1 SubName: Full=Uncharacterized protein {ECO:0000313/EMBL:CCA76323.1} [Serendipita indica DSM 11827]CCA76323.1 hypothetical protein PIIN_10318 [Serendipita indica DSM 11827]